MTTSRVPLVSTEGYAVGNLGRNVGQPCRYRIDGLSIWLMRIAREIGCGTWVQALRERTAGQERADAHQAALLVQGMRPEHRHAPTRQAAGPEGGSRAALR